MLARQAPPVSPCRAKQTTGVVADGSVLVGRALAASANRGSAQQPSAARHPPPTQEKPHGSGEGLSLNGCPLIQLCTGG